jgi:hypothetical protein
MYVRPVLDSVKLMTLTEWLPLCRYTIATSMAGQPPPPSTTAHPTSSGNHDDHSTGTRPSAIGSVDGDSQRADVLDLLVAVMNNTTHSR